MSARNPTGPVRRAAAATLLACALAASPLGAQVVADFDATPTSGLPPLVVSFTDQTTGGTPISWQWDFGDGTLGFAQDPVHVYDTPGTYDVSLSVIAQGGGVATEVKTGLVTVGVPTIAPDFVAAPTSGFIPLEVSFTNTTTGDPVSAWLWDFGDGTTSVEKHPTHVYTAYGSYDVTLTASAGTSSTQASKPGFVSVSAQFTARRVLTGSPIPSGGYAFADVDGDDDLDVVFASDSQQNQGVRLMRNLDGAGTLGQLQTITSPAWANEPEFGDADGDGDPDMLWVHAGGARWARNSSGSGTVWDNSTVTFTSTVFDTAFRDLDDDGLDDVVLAYGDSPSLRVHFADGVAFGGPVTFAGGPAEGRCVDVADLDGDGDPDVVVGGDVVERLAWFENDGAGDLSVVHTVDAGLEEVAAIRAGDVDGDGDADLVFGATDRLAWLENLDGLGTFGAAVTIEAVQVHQVELVDTDRDGDLDVLSRAASLQLLNHANTDGLGAFAPAPQAVLTAAGSQDGALGVADLDRDGDPDVLGGGGAPGAIAGWYENVGLASPWTYLGGAAQGVAGEPFLDAIGTLEAGDPLTLRVTDAPASTLILAWLSFTSVPLDVLGGTLHANPPATQLLRATGTDGAWSQSITWPVSVGADVEFWLQFIVQDGGVPAGLTLTNAVTATTP